LRPVVVLLLALVLAGTAAAHGPRVMAIGQKANGEKAEIHVGDTLVLTLPANSATTFNWRLTTVTRTVLRPDAKGYIPALKPPLAQGAAGVAVFVFKAVRVGTSPLRLVYTKAGAKKPAKTYNTTIRITPAD
jgi:predicted secreted protein